MTAARTGSVFRDLGLIKYTQLLEPNDLIGEHALQWLPSTELLDKTRCCFDRLGIDYKTHTTYMAKVCRITFSQGKFYLSFLKETSVVHEELLDVFQKRIWIRIPEAALQPDKVIPTSK